MTTCIYGSATMYLISLGLRPKEAFPPFVRRLRGALPRSNFRCSVTASARDMRFKKKNPKKTQKLESVIINFSQLKSHKLLLTYLAVVFGFANGCLVSCSVLSNTDTNIHKIQLSSLRILSGYACLCVPPS